MIPIKAFTYNVSLVEFQEEIKQALEEICNLLPSSLKTEVCSWVFFCFSGHCLPLVLPLWLFPDILYPYYRILCTQFFPYCHFSPSSFLSLLLSHTSTRTSFHSYFLLLSCFPLAVAPSSPFQSFPPHSF